MRALWLTVPVCLAALAFPANAVAVKCAPPGVSGVDQYFETIPGASCNQASPGSGPGSGSGNPGAHTLSPGEVRQLSSQGAAGRAVARLVSVTAPPGAQPSAAASGRSASHRRGRNVGHSPRHTGTPPSGQNSAPVSPTGSGENPILGLIRPLVTGWGIGLVLPIVLGAIALVALLTGLARLRAHRHRSSGGP